MVSCIAISSRLGPELVEPAGAPGADSRLAPGWAPALARDAVGGAGGVENRRVL